MTRPRVHYAWVIAAITFLVLIVTSGVRATPGVLMVPLETEFGWSRTAISAAIAINIALYGLIGPFAASLMNRYGLRRIVLAAIATFVLGAAFLGLELREFADMIARGATPQSSAFLSAFFTLVGCHGLHVTFGLIWILIMTSQVIIKGLTIPVASRFLRLGLFWHFLDIIWIGIFSIVYLPGIL